MLKKVASTLLTLGAVISVQGQSDFLGLPISGYLDNISDSAAIQRQAPYVPLGSMGAVKDDKRFWTKRRISLSYAYADTRFDEGSDTSTHAAVPEVYVESRTGQALNLAGLYSETEPDSSSVDVDSETFGVSLQVAQELWRFLAPDDSESQLWLGVAAGGRSSDTELTLPSVVAEADGEGFFIGPNLVYARKIMERLTGLIVPAYTFAWANTDFGSTEVDSDASLFTLTGRADYGVTDHVILTAFATGKREIHVDVEGVDSSSLDTHTWAEFGGSVE